jgi:Homeodomain-like domain
VLRVDHERWGQRPEDLRNLAVKAPHARSRERFLALYEITQGSNATRVATRIGRHPQDVMKWVHRYNAGGPDAVSYRRTGGRVVAPSAAARDLLSKPSTASLSDREIARRAGLSPTTVGKLRRDLGAAARDRSITRHRDGRTEQDLPIASR